jgi:hypothetical protein
VRLGVRRLGGRAHDLEPHRARARERDHVDARVADERGAGVAVAREERERVRGDPGAVEGVDERGGARRRLLGGLQHGGVAGGKRGRGHAAGDGQREVPGGDHHGHAARDVSHRVALARRLHEVAPALELDRLVGVVLEEVDRLADVGVRLGPGLRALAHLERRQLEPALPQARGGVPEHARTFAGGPGAPLAEPALGGLDRRGGLGLAGAAGVRDHPAGRAGVRRVEALGGARVSPDQDRHRQRQPGVQLTQGLEQRLAHRRAAQLQDGLVRKGHGAASSSSIDMPRCWSPRNDSFEVFSRSRRTK